MPDDEAIDAPDAAPALDDAPREEPDAAPDASGTAAARPRRRPSARALLRAAGAALALALVLVAALGAFVGAGMVRVRPACDGCHRAQSESLSKSAHRDADCYACHGGADFGERWIRFGRDATAVFRLGRIAEASVGNHACVDCHDDLREVVEARGLRMSHSTCLSAVTRCTVCHADTAHPQASPARMLDMGSCTSCHDGRRAPDTCATCHVGKRDVPREGSNAWRVTHGANWKSTHGMGDLTTCRVCHADADCTKCHLGVPHRSDWAATHGAEAEKAGKAKCLVCHIRALCDGCHGTVMPHPSGWLAAHPTSTTPAQAAGDGLCRGCHSETDCRECHELHVHPGIPPDKLRQLRGGK